MPLIFIPLVALIIIGLFARYCIKHAISDGDYQQPRD